MMLIDDILIRALIVGACVALFAGPLGCFVVWRRMSYVGDTLAHASLLGVVFALLFEISYLAGVLAVVIAVGLAVHVLRAHQKLPTDTILGLLAHSTLALGLVILSLMHGVRFDLHGILFGDILAVTNQDVIVVGALTIGTLLVVWRAWTPLLTATISEEIALSERINPNRYSLLLIVLLAALIAATMKIVGVLLISSLLIIPAAAAHHFARSPESMAVWASVIGIIAVIGGLVLSFWANTTTGPTIVLVAVVLFLTSALYSVQSRR